MEYQALYRQFRPEVFSDVIGQEHIVRAITNQIESGKVAHAYLFCGTRGTGKTTTARILSRAVNCTNRNGANPCNECEACKSVLNQSAVDVVEIDAASNTSVDNIRDIRDEIIYPPVMLKYKVYIIDEVHMLSTGAFNALLKTLEEPPEHVIFILATTEYHKIPATILSRCQRFDFKRISSQEIKERLLYVANEEKTTIEENALDIIAYAADGSMRDGLSILDKCISFGNDTVTGEMVTKILGIVDDTTLFDISKSIADKDVAQLLKLTENTIKEGRDPVLLTVYLIEHFRCLLIASYVQDAQTLLQVSAEKAEKYKEYAKSFSEASLIDIVKKLSNLYKTQKECPNPKVILEIGLISIAKAGELSTVKTVYKPVETRAPVVKPEIEIKEEPKVIEEKPQPKVENNTINESGTITDKWSDILLTISKDGGTMLSAALNLALPYVSDDKLNVVFKKNAEATMKLINSASNITLIEKAVYEETGKKVKVKFMTDDGISNESITRKEEKSSEQKIEKLAEKFPDIVTIEE